ncbi:MAG: HepT-like ribonuclease domain-containing protein [Solirubrobacteraceae bacterium]
MRGDRERLEDILDMCAKLREHAAGRAETLDANPVLLAAVQRWIEIMGEAAAGVSNELREAHRDVPWRGAIGTRNVLAHGYFDVDLNIIREVIERDVPDLEEKISQILEEEL